MAALATGVSLKWLDNLLSHNAIPGVSGGRQGLERAISMQGMVTIELVRLLNTELAIPISRAVEIASTLSSDADRPRSRTPSGVEISFPMTEVARHLRERLVEAVEAAPRRSRGRPRRE
jgi:hypothetical protein